MRFYSISYTRTGFPAKRTSVYDNVEFARRIACAIMLKDKKMTIHILMNGKPFERIERGNREYHSISEDPAKTRHRSVIIDPKTGKTRKRITKKKTA